MRHRGDADTRDLDRERDDGRVGRAAAGVQHAVAHTHLAAVGARGGREANGDSGGRHAAVRVCERPEHDAAGRLAGRVGELLGATPQRGDRRAVELRDRRGGLRDGDDRSGFLETFSHVVRGVDVAGREAEGDRAPGAVPRRRVGEGHDGAARDLRVEHERVGSRCSGCVDDGEVAFDLGLRDRLRERRAERLPRKGRIGERRALARLAFRRGRVGREDSGRDDLPRVPDAAREDALLPADRHRAGRLSASAERNRDRLPNVGRPVTVDRRAPGELDRVGAERRIEDRGLTPARGDDRALTLLPLRLEVGEIDPELHAHRRRGLRGWPHRLTDVDLRDEEIERACRGERGQLGRGSGTSARGGPRPGARDRGRSPAPSGGARARGAHRHGAAVREARRVTRATGDRSERHRRQVHPSKGPTHRYGST